MRIYPTNETYFYWVSSVIHVLGIASIIMSALALSEPNWYTLSNVFFATDGTQTNLAGAFTNVGIRAFVSTSNVANTASVSNNLTIAPSGDYGSVSNTMFGICMAGTILMGIYYFALWAALTRHAITDRLWMGKWEKLAFCLIFPAVGPFLNMCGMAYYTNRAVDTLPNVGFGPITHGWCFWVFWFFGFGSAVISAVLIATLPNNKYEAAARTGRRRGGRGRYDEETAGATTVSTTNTATTIDTTFGTTTYATDATSY